MKPEMAGLLNLWQHDGPTPDVICEDHR
jgi:hypothetical protein